MNECCDKQKQLSSNTRVLLQGRIEKVNPRLVERVNFMQNLFQAQLRIIKINTPANFNNTRDDIKKMSKFVESNIISNCNHFYARLCNMLNSFN